MKHTTTATTPAPAGEDVLLSLPGLTPATTREIVELAGEYSHHWATTGDSTVGDDWSLTLLLDHDGGRQVTVGHAHVVGALVRLAFRDTAPAAGDDPVRSLLRAAAAPGNARVARVRDLLTASLRDHGATVRDAVAQVDGALADDLLQLAVLGEVRHH